MFLLITLSNLKTECAEYTIVYLYIAYLHCYPHPTPTPRPYDLMSGQRSTCNHRDQHKGLEHPCLLHHNDWHHNKLQMYMYVYVCVLGGILCI